MMRQGFSLEWEAHEYEHKERSSDWFWAVGIVVASIAIASIIFGNIIFGILIIIGTFALTLFINRPPQTLQIRLDEKGITRDKVHYPYQTLESFWIDLDHPHKKIILKSQKTFMPLIIIPLGEDADAEDIHEILSNFLKEEFHALPIIERLLEYFGF